jgi:hypothetical protein
MGGFDGPQLSSRKRHSVGCVSAGLQKPGSAMKPKNRSTPTATTRVLMPATSRDGSDVPDEDSRNIFQTGTHSVIKGPVLQVGYAEARLGGVQALLGISVRTLGIIFAGTAESHEQLSGLQEL